MNNLVGLTAIALLFFIGRAGAQEKEAAAFQAVPELGYRVIPDFFHPQEDFLAVGKDRKIYVAEVLNWRFQVFQPTTPSGKLAEYVPSKRMFWILGEFGMVHAHERAKELGNARLPIAAFVCRRDGFPGLRLFLFRAGDIIHASEEKRPGPTVLWCSTK